MHLWDGMHSKQKNVHRNPHLEEVAYDDCTWAFKQLLGTKWTF